jgi:hypothetical protein
VSATGTCAGAVIVAGLSEPPERIVNVAGSRTFDGAAPPLAGAPGFVVVSVPVGGVPVAVGVVCVVVPVVVAVVAVVAVVVPVVVAVVVDGVAAGVDLLPDGDAPHPTGVVSSTTHKRTAIPLTFAG